MRYEVVKGALRTTWRRISRKIGSEALRREKASMKQGIRRYGEYLGSGKDLFFLRRNVHMIEKGLTMRPRRPEFALAYIEQTVNSLEFALRRGSVSRSDPEVQWMLDVLQEYFDATATSGDSSVRRSALKFGQMQTQSSCRPLYSGPQAPPKIAPVINELEGLAQGRRSVRWFMPDVVERRIVDRAVSVAAESPSACNRQPYRFEIIDDRDSVRKVAAVPMGTKGYADQIPAMVVVVGDLSAFFDERDRHLIYIDGALASMGLVYGLEAQGVSTCCINWPDLPDRELRMQRLLRLEKYERVVMLIAYGYADRGALAPFSAKRNIDDVRRYRSL